MTDILIGGPVSQRAWVLPRWYDHCYEACRRADVNPTFIHVGAAEDPTMNCTVPDAVIVPTGESARGHTRKWTHARYQQMAEYRNIGLAKVRELAPPLFLSLDSDVLLHPDAITSLLNGLTHPAGFAAVGGKCFMNSSVQYPSYGMFVRNGGIRRSTPVTGFFKVDVIMAIKLMTPAAYNVDYRYHQHGEDLGWARACQEAGLVFAFDARITSKHLYKPEYLNIVDPKVGF